MKNHTMPPLIIPPQRRANPPILMPLSLRTDKIELGKDLHEQSGVFSSFFFIIQLWNTAIKNNHNCQNKVIITQHKTQL